MNKKYKPFQLKKGDRIGIVAASEPVVYFKDRFEKGVEYMRKKGFGVTIGNHVYDVHGYLSGKDEDRAKDINQMIFDKSVKAIIFASGGYNTNRLLPLIDYDSLRENPKIVLGVSDPTVLLNGIYAKTGIPTFHGLSVVWSFSPKLTPFSDKSFREVLMEGNSSIYPEKSRWKWLKNGEGEGRLVGGNLECMAGLVGTEYMPNTKDAILFLEGIDMQPHLFDSTLSHLKLAGIFKNAKGVAFGKFIDCENKEFKETFKLEDIILSTLGEYKFPIVFNVDIGHQPNNLVIPIGINAKLSSRTKEFGLLEPAVRRY